MDKIYGVVFKKNGKVYNFSWSDSDLDIDTGVIVETEKGNQFGFIAEKDLQVENRNIRPIIRVATEKDLKQHEKNQKDSDLAMKKAQSYAHDLDIDMKIIDASYTFDRRQLLFNFIASERVDFRELVKLLASEYHTRIELRQIGVRDKAKVIGGLGQCGREQCCSCFLDNIDSITINMAKNQDIALNPSKINGACGRLLCCLTYEDEIYTENRKELPKIGEIVNTEYGKGKVEMLNILEKKYTVTIGNEKYELECLKKTKNEQKNEKNKERGNHREKRQRK